MGELKYKDIYVRWNDGKLVIGNAAIERTLNIANGYPETISLKDLRHNRELVKPTGEIDFNYMGYNMPGLNNVVFHIEEIKAEPVQNSLYDNEHVRVTIKINEPNEEIIYLREYIIYPELPAIAVRNYITPAVNPNVYWTYRELLRCRENRATNGPHYCSVDAVIPGDDINRFDAVEFMGRTDDNDVQVFEHFDVKENTNGNLLYCSNADNGYGFVFLQEAPPSPERRDMENFDFYFTGNNRIRSCCWGVAPHEIKPNETYRSYRHIIILFNDDMERRTAVFNYMKTRYHERPQDHAVMVNPWGCCDFPKRVSEAFLIDEIKAAAKLGADCYQIDDGWQHGRGLWDMMGGNFHLTRKFWDISTTRLNGTFEPMVKTAEENNIDLALWTAPSCNLDYIDWESFADMVIKYHNECGFNFFKIDAMMLRSYESERNVEKIFTKARNASNGEIFFNLDVTNGQRGGYFYFLEYGNIFLENRYIGLSVGIGYHPEKTLKSIWRLAKYTRLQLLQVEVPNRGMFNEEFYRKNKSYHVMPNCYSQKYWAAVAMFANPLLWFAPSQLNDECASDITEMVELHKKYRSDIFAGDIIPIGAEPDGRAFTGFWSRRENAGMIIVYREYGCSLDYDLIDLPGVDVTAEFELVAGNGCVKAEDGKWRVTIPEAAGFAMFKYSK